MMKEKERKNKWLAWDLEKEYPFSYFTRKDAEKDIKIFNKELGEWKSDRKYYLFKLIK